jgi:hypothetical protein
MHHNESSTIEIFSTGAGYSLYKDKSFFNFQKQESSKILQGKQNAPFLEMNL